VLTSLSDTATRVETANTTSCPVCDGPSHRLFQRHGFWIQECRSCSHRFARPDDADRHVATVYGDDYFFGGGAGYENYLSEADLLRAHGRRYGKLPKRWMSAGRMLDVGAAAGFVLRGFHDEGWSGEGVEPNAAMARYARETLGMHVSAGSLEDFQPADGNAGGFDLVSLIQVIGHFIEPRDALANVERLTRPGGYCLIESWNVQSWSARLFGENWHEYSPPSVLHWFSPRTLNALMAPFGFEPVAQGRPQKWLNVGHARSLLAHKADASLIAKLARTTFRCLPASLNLPYPSEDLFWTLYRKAPATSEESR